ncbi:hypothetical protein Avbf_14302 [Armadillidium vulgare]|nr:hypothetical protein Avbf_14302 [Armadillidium vulgare]
MQKLLYISNGVQLEIDRVIVVPLEILNRHCRKIPIGNRQFRILIHSPFPHEKRYGSCTNFPTCRIGSSWKSMWIPFKFFAGYN